MAEEPVIEEAQPFTEEELGRWEERTRTVSYKDWGASCVLRLIQEIRRLRAELQGGLLLEEAQRNAAASGLSL